MNHIILSIQPQWLAKILNGEKTVEIRKTVPKLPCTVWFYCTKAKPLLGYNVTEWASGWATFDSEDGFCDVPLGFANGQIVAKFVLEKASEIINAGCRFEIAYSTQAQTEIIAKASCLDFKDLQKYLGLKDGWAWPISNLTILDKPLSLGDFYTIRKNEDDGEVDAWVTWKAPVRKAPQSWLYCTPKGELK